MKDNVIGIIGIGYIKSCELAKELVNTKIVGNTKKLNEIIEEEKSFKITAPEPIEIDNLVISNVKERSVIPPNFYKKRRNWFHTQQS